MVQRVEAAQCRVNALWVLLEENASVSHDYLVGCGQGPVQCSEELDFSVNRYSPAFMSTITITWKPPVHEYNLDWYDLLNSILVENWI